MKKRNSRLPEFKDEDEEREFWATHSPLDYFDSDKARRGCVSEPEAFVEVDFHPNSLGHAGGIESPGQQNGCPLPKLGESLLGTANCP